MVLMRLELTVIYDQNGVPESELAAMMEDIVKRATSEGMLTQDTPAEVEEYAYTIRSADTCTLQVSSCPDWAKEWIWRFN
jgi:hypothetical protein